MRKSGFTLLEVSVVLIVIGLIVGGIIVGGNMMRNAEIQSFIKEVESIRQMVSTFETKFESLPGDMSDASVYWSACTDSGANTCNGDDDGQIERDYERIRAWQHMMLAGISPYKVTGLWNTDGLEEGDVNVPLTPLGENIAFGLEYLEVDIGGADPFWFETEGNYITTGRLHPSTANQFPGFGFLLPEEAYSIDVKVDDGKPALGKWRSIGRLYNRNDHTLTNNNAWSCSDSDDESTAEYVLDLDIASCSFNISFE